MKVELWSGEFASRQAAVNAGCLCSVTVETLAEANMVLKGIALTCSVNTPSKDLGFCVVGTVTRID